MKQVLLYILLLLFLWHNAAMSEERKLGPELLGEIDSKTFRPFFNALKNGNIEVIKRYFTEQKSEEVGLLDLKGEEYKEYSEMLKKRYKGAVYFVQQGAASEEQITVDVVFEFPGGGRSVTQFYLKEQIGGAGGVSEGKHWRIAAERKKREGKVGAE